MYSFDSLTIYSHPCSRNDIVWICKQCQKDVTCVLCNSCWEHDKHAGHEIFFYHSNTGGCCDCGDVDAWDKNGFCAKHSVKGNRNEDPLSQVPKDILDAAIPSMTEIIRSILMFAYEYKETYNLDRELDGNWRILVHQNGIYGSQKTSDIISNQISAECALQYENSMAFNKTWAFIDLSNEVNDVENMNSIIEKLRAHNLKISIPSDEIVRKDAEIVKLLKWLYRMSQISDAHCRIICNTFKAADELENQESNFLIELLQVEPYLSSPVTENLHEFFLTLMAEQSFNMILAVAYATSYTHLSLVNQELSHKCPLFESGLFHLSVQFLNREVFVAEIVDNYNFLQSLCVSLLKILDIDSSESSFDKSITTDVIKHRRYNYVFNDIKIIFTIPRMAQCFIDDSQCLYMFLSILNGYQYSDRIKRETFQHVVHESIDWQYSFSLFLAVSSVYEPLLQGWYDMMDLNYKQQQLLMKNGVIQPTFNLLLDVLSYIHEWQNHFVSRNNLYRIHTGRVRLLQVPSDFGYSFHLYSNRFLSAVISLGCGYAHHTATINKFIDTLRLPEFSNFTLPILLDTTLLTLVFASQIKEGLWRRNGFSMFEQLSHYSSSILAKQFRDSDLFLLQFMVAVCSHTPDSVDSMLSHILFRYAADPRYYNQIFPYAFPLVGEFLSLIISIVTELPLPPSAFDNDKNEDYTRRLLPLLRRQIIHRLASGNASHSDLHESCLHVADSNSLKMEYIDQVIKEVAETRSNNDASKLHLKNEYWSEYDPGNMRVSNKMHQEILEKRPKIKEVSPMVSEPLPIHPSFLGVANLLFSSSIFLVLRNLAFSYLCELQQSTKEKVTSESGLHQLLLLQSDFVKSVEDLVFDNCNSAYFTKTLQLLTLMIHHSKSASVADIGVFIGHLMKCESVIIEGKEESDSPIASTLVLPHMLCVLIDIYDCLSKNEEGNNRYWLQWVINSIGSMDASCATYIHSRFELKLEEERKVEMEIRKKQARERAMAKIQKSAAVFSSFLADDSDEESKPVNSDPNIEKIVCIICQEEGEDICMQAFSQRSNYVFKNNWRREHASVDAMNTAKLCQIGENYYYTPNPASVCTGAVNDVADHDTHVSLCGHAMHSHCFDSYFATLFSRLEFILDTNLLDFSNGEFHCPICKRLNNILLPLPSQEVVKSVQSRQGHTDLLQYLSDVHGVVEAYVPHIDPYFSMLEYDINDYISAKVELSTACLTPLQQRYLHFLDNIHEPMRHLLNDYCTRRLRSLDSDDDPYPFYNLLLYITCAIKATAFSLSADEQKSPLLAHQEAVYDMPSTADKRYLLKSLSGCLEAFGVDALIAKYVLIAVENRRRIVIKDNTNNELETDHQYYMEAQKTYFRYLWFLNNPLLAMPLYEVAMLSIILRDTSLVSEAGSISGLFSHSHLALLGLARLIQSSVTEGLQFFHGSYSGAGDSASLDSLEQFQPVTSKVFSFISLALSKVNGAFADLNTLPPSLIMRIFNQWYAFLQSVVNLQSIHSDEKQESQLNLVALFDYFGYQQLFVSAEIHPTVLAKIEMWISDLFQHGGINASSPTSNIVEDRYTSTLLPQLLQCSRYPLDENTLNRNVLLKLPHSYTEFHGLIASGAPYDTPVVCLHCGLICDASGKGECTRHASTCNVTNSVFFLIDDCKLLFMHKGRAVYYLAPYIDEYGERHERDRHFRAKPLYLDSNYYDSVQNLVAKHQIPREVHAKRSLSSRVIILGYY